MTKPGLADLISSPLNVRSPDATERITAALAEHGVAVFDGVNDRTALLRLATQLGSIATHPHSDPSGITTITTRPGPLRAGAAAFTDRDLTPHTDRSSLPYPPALVLAVCARAAPRGGESLLVNGRAVHATLSAQAPEAVADLAGERNVLFGGAAGHLGSVFEPQPEGRVAIRLRMDELAQFSPRTQRWLPQLRQAILDHSDALALPAGRGYVVNNRWWLHGRHHFTGDRMMWRVLLDPPPGRITPGFLPEHSSTLRDHRPATADTT
ncbi:TauD/TfdA family dioxygenase [Amycolatopsis sp. cmx-4-54]|uniref:TauD/TfdA family dioxygenase n=1 Tax=Amycolatopsis sp. cmx-4-54 TaxID=2790936 RepID=UPI003978730F